MERAQDERDLQAAIAGILASSAKDREIRLAAGRYAMSTTTLTGDLRLVGEDGVVLVDNLWVRLVDLPRALTDRGYAAACDVVLEVTDELCPWNAGRWQVTRINEAQ